MQIHVQESLSMAIQRAEDLARSHQQQDPNNFELSGSIKEHQSSHGNYEMQTDKGNALIDTPVEAMQGLIDEAIPNYIECEKLAGNKVSWVLMDLYRDLKNKPLTKESPFNDANGGLIKTYASSIPDWV